MNRDILKNWKNTLSSRLLLLRRKMKRFGPALRAWMMRMRQKRGAQPKKRRINWQMAKINAVPLCLVAIMLVLLSGTMQSLAWYTDTAVERNRFVIGDMELKVFYDNDVTDSYTEMTSTSSVFNDQALYEPGYTQVVYFKIENAGDVEFDYQISVNEVGYTDSTSVLGNNIHLADYLTFGLKTAPTQDELTRVLAQAFAKENLDAETHFGVEEYTQKGTRSLGPGEQEFAALVVYMDERVGNEANYDKNAEHTPPQTILGIDVYAQQADTME